MLGKMSYKPWYGTLPVAEASRTALYSFSILFISKWVWLEFWCIYSFLQWNWSHDEILGCNAKDKTISCSKFETMGVLCCHILKLYSIWDVKQIPDHYIVFWILEGFAILVQMMVHYKKYFGKCKRFEEKKRKKER